MNGNPLYRPRFFEFLERVEINSTVLPATLQTLIGKYENAFAACQQETEDKGEWLEVLVKTDAVICAQIYQLYKSRLEEGHVDKVKLMALRAKALQLKWKLK